MSQMFAKQLARQIDKLEGQQRKVDRHALEAELAQLRAAAAATSYQPLLKSLGTRILRLEDQLARRGGAGIAEQLLPLLQQVQALISQDPAYAPRPRKKRAPNRPKTPRK